MAIGTITTLKLTLGYGFVRVAGATGKGADVFFHCRSLAAGLDFDETLRERRVKFDVVTTDRGPRAENVRPID